MVNLIDSEQTEVFGDGVYQGGVENTLPAS